jgi:hypothetical protein
MRTDFGVRRVLLKRGNKNQGVGACGRNLNVNFCALFL